MAPPFAAPPMAGKGASVPSGFTRVTRPSYISQTRTLPSGITTGPSGPFRPEAQTVNCAIVFESGLPTPTDTSAARAVNVAPGAAMAARAVIDCRHERRLMSAVEWLIVTPPFESLVSFTTVGIPFKAVNELQFRWPQVGHGSGGFSGRPIKLARRMTG